MSDMHLTSLLETLGLDRTSTANATRVGADPVMPSRFHIAEAASTALLAGGLAADAIWQKAGGKAQALSVDAGGAAASLISFLFQNLEVEDPPTRDMERPLVNLYPARDGRWVHLHGAFPRLADGTLKVLGCRDEKQSVADAVAQWEGQALEDALAAEGLCGAMARSREEWLAHPQGMALSRLPAVEILKIGESDPEPLAPRTRPLEGMRVLDLTRVLAGPTCARTLASHGAEVLKINSPNLPSVPVFVIDTGHGKRSAFLDLDESNDAATLKALVKDADVFSQGYRAGALARRGFGPGDLAALRPGIIYVSINAYGPVGPWAGRPGWEQLAQTASGIAVDEGGMESPRLIPAAATDYTTGYLAAAGVMAALLRRAEEGGSYHVRCSLCQTANWLYDFGLFDADRDFPAPDLAMATPFMTTTESGFGRLTHMRPVLHMSETQPHWVQPTVPLGTHAPKWT